MTSLDEVAILHIFRTTMESFEGEGDSIHSTDNDQGEQLQNLGELVPGFGPGPPPSGASAELVQGGPSSRERHAGVQERGDEHRSWLRRIRRRRRRRAALAGHHLNADDNEPPWLPPHDINPYTARELRDAACQAAGVSMILNWAGPWGLSSARA